jgi:hypothetical protein
MRRSASTSTRPATATITTAPRVAWGRFSNSGVRNSRVSTTTPAVTTPATWLRTPVSRLTAVWDSPPPAGKAWKHPPARFAPARARSSWVGVDLGFALGPERPRGRDRLDERHQGDARGRRQQRLHHGQVGRGELRQAGRDLTDQGHATIGHPGRDGQQDAEGHHQQRARQRPRRPAPQRQQDQDAGDRQRHRRQAELVQV